MNLTDSIITAKQRGADSKQILQELMKKRPDKQPQLQESLKRGATADMILNEILKQNAPIKQEKSFLQKIGGAISDTAEFAKDIGLGIGKGALTTAVQTYKLGQGLSKISPVSMAAQAITGKEIPQLDVDKYISPELYTASGVTQKTAKATEQVAEVIGSGITKLAARVVKTPLSVIAEKLYLSTMKPSTTLPIAVRKELANIGLNERIFLTEGGLEKTAQKVDKFEELLDTAIIEAKQMGKKVNLKGIQGYLNEAKELFKDNINVDLADNAIKEIDSIGEKLLKKYGDEIPIEIAQKIKTSTYQTLSKYYGKLSGATEEGMKQGVRYIKDVILKEAPKVRNINERLSDLYKFDKALSRASARITNKNILGLATKAAAIAATGTRSVGTVATGVLTDIAGMPAVKSAAAISLNELSKLGEKGQIPLASLLAFIKNKIGTQE